jgi:cell division protein FtsI/penicillin-binding protein 2
MSDRARVGILIFCLFAGSAVLVVRLFSISVLQHSKYIAKADNQQNVEKTILPRRGNVYVQDQATGQPSLVATSLERYALSVTPHDVTDPGPYAKLLAKISGADEGNLLKIFNEKGFYMEPIMHGLTKDQVSDIGKKLSELDIQLGVRTKAVDVNFDSAQGDIIYYLGGTYFQREYQRTYPEAALLGQELGFVNNKGVGQYGFEGQYDQQLKGYAGQLKLEQDSTGHLLSATDSVQGKDGSNYVLSIDRNVQYRVEQELAQQVKDDEAKGGSVIIMDPKTGEIVAMANTPSYDPNNFSQTAKDHIDYFDNQSISNMWEPGSIFKPIIMSAAIDQNLVQPDTRNTFAASVTVDGHTINTALNKAFGDESMTDVLVNSDNVAMVWVANKLGNQTMFDYLQKYGFGTATGVDLANEITGDLPGLAIWRNITRATVSFGQGIGVTPLQIAAAYSAIANGGNLVRPRIVHALVNASGKEQLVPTTAGQQIIKPETAAKLRDMLTAVVVHNHKKAGVDGYKIGGKTGTAQVPDSKNGGYLPNAYNHSFAGMIPADDPKFVMLVKIDEPNIAKVGTFAESTAVPLFGRLAQFLVNYYQIPPTNK